MFSPIVALVLLSLGFIAGYGVRALISRKRRAISREMSRKRKEQKIYDEGVELNPLP